MVTSGVITGFGSVYVNGTHFETSGAEISKDGQRISQSGLREWEKLAVDGRRAIGSQETDNWPPARSFADYAVTLDGATFPDLVKVVDVS